MTKAYFGLVQGSCTAATSGRPSSRAKEQQQQEEQEEQQRQRQQEEQQQQEEEEENGEALSCDVFVSYDRDANGGEGPDCPMCKVQRLHGNEDQVYVMRVSVQQQ